MINLIPFYMNCTSRVHREVKDTGNNDQNRKFSESLLISILPAMADYITDRLDHRTVVVVPSASEGGKIADYLVRFLNSNSMSQHTNLVKLEGNCSNVIDLEHDAGIFILSPAALHRLVIKCDRLVTYYPFHEVAIKQFYSITDTMALFDPINSRANWYSQYIRFLIDRKTGVRKDG